MWKYIFKSFKRYIISGCYHLDPPCILQLTNLAVPRKPTIAVLSSALWYSVLPASRDTLRYYPVDIDSMLKILQESMIP